MVGGGVGRRSQFVYGVKESISESVSELSPALFDRIEFRRIRRECDEVEVVTSPANGIADDLRADGWDVVVVRAAHAAPLPPDADETDRFGLVYVAPDDVAESLPAAVDRAELTQSAAFRQQVGTDLFLLTRVSDPDERVAVLLVGAVDLDRSETSDLADAARSAGVLYSHVELLDGTHLNTFEHDHPEDFIPVDG